jgi:hypothetical protein
LDNQFWKVVFKNSAQIGEKNKEAQIMNRKGFTLIELLVLLAVVGLLVIIGLFAAGFFKDANFYVGLQSPISQMKIWQLIVVGGLFLLITHK